MSADNTPAYPPAPWETTGFGVFAPLILRARTVSESLPDGLRAISRGGRCWGMLAYVRYDVPSPLQYDELVLITCVAEVVDPRVPRERPVRGYYVSRMVVDSEPSVAAGREMWGFPKDFARFEHEGGKIVVRCEDGACVTMHHRVRRALGRRAVKADQTMTTVQAPGDGRIIRFRSHMRGQARMAKVQLEHVSWTDPAWAPLGNARMIPGAAVAVDFQATMGAPEVLAP